MKKSRNEVISLGSIKLRHTLEKKFSSGWPNFRRNLILDLRLVRSVYLIVPVLVPDYWSWLQQDYMISNEIGGKFHFFKKKDQSI